MDLWTELAAWQAAGGAIALYGMGDGADKAITVLESRGLHADAVFASDEFVRGQLFHGMRVQTFAEVQAQFGEKGIFILVCFGSHLPEVIERVRELAKTVQKSELFSSLWRIPDLPVTVDDPEILTKKGGIFDETFLSLHQEKLTAARALFADAHSVRLFDNMVKYKLTGEMEPLFAEVSAPEEVYSELLSPENYRCCMDLGAYTGDTVREWQKFLPGVQKILCMEPDGGSYRRLCRYAETLGGLAEPLRAAAWDKEEDLVFSTKGNRNSTLLSAGHGAKSETVPGIPPDRFAENRRIDYIKYDVEGAERQALLGSRRILREDRPDVLLSLYHRPEDLFALPLLLRELLDGEYRFFLRRMNGFPAWDLNLYAVRSLTAEQWKILSEKSIRRPVRE